MTVESKPQTTYCTFHPDRETYLRCNRCERPICTQCAVLTDTGYRCKECVRGQQKVFDTAQWFDYPLTIIVAALLSYAGSYLASLIGFFTIFIAPIVGGLIAGAVRLVLRKRRSKRLFQIAAAAAIVGSLPLLAVDIFLLSASLQRGMAGFGLLGLLWQGLYTFIVGSTVYYRLSGIQIR